MSQQFEPAGPAGLLFRPAQLVTLRVRGPLGSSDSQDRPAAAGATLMLHRQEGLGSFTRRPPQGSENRRVEAARALEAGAQDSPDVPSATSSTVQSEVRFKGGMNKAPVTRAAETGGIFAIYLCSLSGPEPRSNLCLALPGACLLAGPHCDSRAPLPPESK